MPGSGETSLTGLVEPKKIFVPVIWAVEPGVGGPGLEQVLEPQYPGVDPWRGTSGIVTT